LRFPVKSINLAFILFALVTAACSAGTVSPTPPTNSSSGPSSSETVSVAESAAISEAPSGEPASGRIAFGRYDRSVGDFVAYLIDPNGSGETQLLPDGHELPRWSPDGKDIVLIETSLTTVIVENAGLPNGSVRSLSLPPAPLNLGCVVWSPDGTRLACEGWDDTDPTRNGIYTVSAADGSDLQRLTSSPNGAHDIPGDYSADGSQLFFAREHGPIMVVGVGGSDLRPVTSGTYGPPSLSPDGKTLLADDGGTIYLIAIDGGVVTPITILGTTMDAFGASWSPDGTWVVFSLSTASGTADIARVRLDGTGLFRITNDPANEEMADWAL
jgi:Tol biopolymer transport system component